MKLSMTQEQTHKHRDQTTVAKEWSRLGIQY